jgi:hypothetical protein
MDDIDDPLPEGEANLVEGAAAADAPAAEDKKSATKAYIPRSNAAAGNAKPKDSVRKGNPSETTKPAGKAKDEQQKQAKSGKKAPADATAGSTCAAAASSLTKRIGFRTIELVRDPLPKAIKDLFGNNTGFEYAQQKQYVHSILSRDNAGQWAMDENGQWTHFPGNDTDVSFHCDTC